MKKQKKENLRENKFSCQLRHLDYNINTQKLQVGDVT